MDSLFGNIFVFISLVFFIASCVLAFLFIDSTDRAKCAEETQRALQQSFNEVDEQARITVKTDLELHKTQAELNKRIKGLEALKDISHLVGTTLFENEIFQSLNEANLSELGFEKYLILAPSATQKLKCHVSFGFSDKEISTIITQLEEDSLGSKLLQSKQMISSVKQADKNIHDKLSHIFNVKHFLIANLRVQAETIGFIFAGNQTDAFAFTEGDEELISILSDQISHAIKNARYYEESIRHGQKLKLAVDEQTKQLTSALEEVRKVSKMKSEFISAVSHELRTPLTSIKGYASILIAEKIGQIPDAVKERLEKINKHSDNLVKLINDLLDIARIESGRTAMNFVRHSLLEIVDAVGDLLTPQMKEKNIKFVAQFPKDFPEITADGNQLERIFINLIGNAIKFTPENGTITTKAEIAKDHVVISVSDTGVGIKEEDMVNLFDEFYRVDNEINQTVKGSGLGLALAKKIVDAHRGKIWVKSKVNEGTTFYFSLPTEQTITPKKKA